MSSNVSPLTSIHYCLPWPYLFPLVCLPPPLLPQQPPTTTTTTPPVCLAVTQSAMCVLKTLHNALLSLHSRSKRTIQHRKIAPCWFFFSSTITLFYQTSVPRNCIVDCIIICLSIPLHVENQTEQMGNDQRFTVKKKKKKANQVRPEIGKTWRRRFRRRDVTPRFFWCALIHLLASLHAYAGSQL